MKKLLSFILVFVLIFSCGAVAFAQGEEYIPTVHVTGMANTDLIMDKGLETEKAGTVNAVEVLFKGFLETGLAHISVHGVAFFLEFCPFRIVHTAQVTQNMGTVLGVVFPDSGSFDLQTGGIQLQNGGQLLVGNVFQEGVGG